MKRDTLEILTGAATLVVFVGVLVLSYSSDRLQAGIGYDLTARFRNVDGLAVGSDVLLAGITVGTVTDQRFDAVTRQAVVTFHMDGDVKIPADSAAMIISKGILGTKFVRIEPGGDNVYLEAGGEFDFVQNSVILEDMLEKLIKEVEATRKKAQQKTEQ